MWPLARLERFSRLLLIAAIAGLGLLALLSLRQAILRTGDRDGGIDLYAYWFEGHALRQGSNPYYAYLSGRKPSPPVTYLDGVTQTTGPIGQPGLPTIPTNTAPLSLILFALSFFTWPLAKWLWLWPNLALVLATPPLALKLFPCKHALSRGERWLASTGK